jgi:hypothetical protein
VSYSGFKWKDEYKNNRVNKVVFGESQLWVVRRKKVFAQKLIKLVIVIEGFVGQLEVLQGGAGFSDFDEFQGGDGDRQGRFDTFVLLLHKQGGEAGNFGLVQLWAGFVVAVDEFESFWVELPFPPFLHFVDAETAEEDVHLPELLSEGGHFVDVAVLVFEGDVEQFFPEFEEFEVVVGVGLREFESLGLDFVGKLKYPGYHLVLDGVADRFGDLLDVLQFPHGLADVAVEPVLD